MSKSEVIVESAVALSTEQTDAVSKLLKEKLGSSEFTAKVNPAILGGLRITAGSTRYDASVLGKLETLRAQ